MLSKHPPDCPRKIVERLADPCGHPEFDHFKASISFHHPSNNPKLVDEQESWVVVSIKLRQSLGEHLLFAALFHH